MKNLKLNKILFGALLASSLVACGQDPQYGPMGPYGAGGSYCAAPAQHKDRTVLGNLPGGAYLKLDLFSEGSGRIAAVGELRIPSVESLFIGNVGNYMTNPNMLGNGYAGANSQFVTCVSSNGFTGSFERNSSYQEITIVLTGDANTYIEMGRSVGPITASVVGDGLEGNVLMRVGNYPQTPLFMER